MLNKSIFVALFVIIVTIGGFVAYEISKIPKPPPETTSKDLTIPEPPSQTTPSAETTGKEITIKETITEEATTEEGQSKSKSESLPSTPQIQPTKVDLKVNGSDGPITADRNISLSLSWTVMGNPSSCTADGQWKGLKSKNGGTEAVVVPSNISGALSWRLTCAGVTDSVIANIAKSTGVQISLSQPSPSLLPQPSPPTPQSSSQRISQNLFILEDNGTFFSGNLFSVNAQNVARAFYQAYTDVYDFLGLYTLKKISGYYAGTAKNQEQGFGAPILDNSQSFGSKGRLRGVGVVGNFDSSFASPAFFLAQSMVHEIAHFWLVYAGDPNNCEKNNSCRGKLRVRADNYDYGHWSLFIDGTVEIGGLAYQGIMKTSAWKTNPDGSFSHRAISQDETQRYRFNDIELYLMGLISPMNVQNPLPLIDTQTSEDTLRNTWCCIPESERKVFGAKKLITANDIIAMEGPRTPSYPNTQKDFKVAQILILEKGQQLSSEVWQRFLDLEREFPRVWKETTRGYSTINE